MLFSIIANLDRKSRENLVKISRVVYVMMSVLLMAASCTVDVHVSVGQGISDGVALTLRNRALNETYDRPTNVRVNCQVFGMTSAVLLQPHRVFNQLPDEQVRAPEQLCAPGGVREFLGAVQVTAEPVYHVIYPWVPLHANLVKASRQTFVLTIPPLSGQVVVQTRKGSYVTVTVFADDHDEQVLPFVQMDELIIRHNIVAPATAEVIYVVNFKSGSLQLPAGKNVQIICRRACVTVYFAHIPYKGPMYMDGWWAHLDYAFTASSRFAEYRYIPATGQNPFVTESLCVAYRYIERFALDVQPSVKLWDTVWLSDGSNVGRSTGLANIRVFQKRLLRDGRLPGFTLPTSVMALSRDELTRRLPRCTRMAVA